MIFRLPIRRLEAPFRAPFLALCLGALLLALLSGCGSGPSGEAGEPSPLPPTLDGKGYQARACGFDLDGDGIRGENEDCNLCDGTTADPDGDGVDEDLVYIDCDAGVDGATCGTADSPCASLTFAWKNVVDGPQDGAEDILCFRGTCREKKLHPTSSGVPGVFTVAASGSQEKAWEYPKDPTMLVGWDSDDDGEYPPYDTDDTAVLDGSDGAARAFELDDDNSYLEMAHFTVRNFGRFSRSDDSGWLRFKANGESLSHLYFHDQVLESVNMDRAAGREISALHLTTESMRLHWLEVSNFLVTDNGGAFALGAAPAQGPDLGPFRFQNISRTAHSCDFDDCDNAANTLVFAFSGHISGFEILDSAWWANTSLWQPKTSGGSPGAAFITVAQYSQDWLIRNNDIYDHMNGLIVRGGAAANYLGNDPRPVDNIVFDRNYFLNTFEAWKYGDAAVDIRGGDKHTEMVHSVSVTNNILVSTAPWDACIWVKTGNEQQLPSGRILVANNTCKGVIDRYAALVIGNPDQDLTFPHPDVQVSSNVVTGLEDGDLNLQVTYSPESWKADHNVYDPAGIYRWLDEPAEDLATLRQLSGAEESTKACEPTFASNRDLHLDPSDTCARNHGASLPEVPHDHDGEPRSASTPDSGADEIPDPAAEQGVETPDAEDPAAALASEPAEATNPG